VELLQPGHAEARGARAADGGPGCHRQVVTSTLVPSARPRINYVSIIHYRCNYVRAPKTTIAAKATAERRELGQHGHAWGYAWQYAPHARRGRGRRGGC
jgi:hypothetical protein